MAQGFVMTNINYHNWLYCPTQTNRPTYENDELKGVKMLNFLREKAVTLELYHRHYCVTVFVFTYTI